MKTLIKVSDLELIKNGQGIALLRAGVVVAKFANEQLLPAIVALLSFAGLAGGYRKISPEKVMSNFQQSLF